MERKCSEAGATLIELIVVVGIIAAFAGTLGTLFLAGPSVAVAAAVTGITAAFDEGRRTAGAFDAATVVFAPPPSGTGFSVRIYRRFPGDAAFAPSNGPTYDSATTARETAGPLGSPGMAFTIDHRGAVTGYAGFQAGASSFDRRACPAGGAYSIAVRSGPQARTVTIPCALALTSGMPVAYDTAPPAATPAPAATTALACAAGSPCPLPTLIAALAPTPAPTAPGTSAPVHQQVADRCGTPAGQLAFTDTTTNPPTDHLTDGLPCSSLPATPAPAAAFPGRITIGFWVEECAGGAATCDGGNLVDDESPVTILGGPTDYVACNIDPHPLGGLPRTINNVGLINGDEWQGSSDVPPTSTFVRYETRWDIVVPPGFQLVIADPGTDGC